MIELAWWVLLRGILLAIAGCVLIYAAASTWHEARGGRAVKRRDAYVDWCRRNLWCPEHNVPDGHSGIFPGPDGLLTVGPCPGSATRHAVPWAGSRVEMWRAIAEERRRG